MPAEKPDTLDGVEAPTPLPDMHELTGGGRWGLLCGGCLHAGNGPGLTPEIAWRELQSVGWSWFRCAPNLRGYPLCPKCTANPPDADAAAKRARRGRRKK